MNRVLAFFSALILFVGCHHAQPSALANAEPYSPVDGAVVFKAEPSAPAADGSTTWTATYVAQGAQTRFLIHLNAVDGSDGNTSIAFGKGNLAPVGGSQPLPLLTALKTALQAKQLPANVKPVAMLPITFAILGTHMSRVANGGFDLNPRGSWTAIKIFLPADEDQEPPEVFLNLDADQKLGEFAIKDADYGDDVLKQLAKVF